MKKCFIIAFLVLCACALCEDAVATDDAVVTRIFVTSIEEVYRAYFTVMQNVNIYVIKRIGNKYYYTNYHIQYDPVDSNDYIDTIHNPLTPCQKSVSSYKINEKKKMVENTELRSVDGMFIRSDIEIIQDNIISFYITEDDAIKHLIHDWAYIKLFNAIPLGKE